MTGRTGRGSQGAREPGSQGDRETGRERGRERQGDREREGGERGWRERGEREGEQGSGETSVLGICVIRFFVNGRIKSLQPVALGSVVKFCRCCFGTDDCMVTLTNLPSGLHVKAFRVDLAASR